MHSAGPSRRRAPLQAPAAERTDQHPVEHVEALDAGRPAARARASSLQSMLIRAVGPRRQQLLEARDGLAPVDAGRRHVLPGELRDVSWPSARPLQVVVVEGDHDAVGGDVDVGLEVREAEVDGVLERRHRVLRCLAGASAMGEGDRARPVEEGVRGPAAARHGHQYGRRMSVTPLPLAGERFTGTESAAVTSPYDGHEIGRVPVCGPDDVDRAVAAARQALAGGPLPAWKRAEVLDTAAVLLAERRDQFARIIAEEAAKPMKTARVEAERAVGTMRFAAAEARTLGGDVVPLDALAARRGQGRLHDPRARSASSAPSARSTSRSTSSPTRWRRPSPPAARWSSSRPARRRSAPSPWPTC